MNKLTKKKKDDLLYSILNILEESKSDSILYITLAQKTAVAELYKSITGYAESTNCGACILRMCKQIITTFKI